MYAWVSFGAPTGFVFYLEDSIFTDVMVWDLQILSCHFFGGNDTRIEA